MLLVEVLFVEPNRGYALPDVLFDDVKPVGVVGLILVLQFSLGLLFLNVEVKNGVQLVDLRLQSAELLFSVFVPTVGNDLELVLQFGCSSLRCHG